MTEVPIACTLTADAAVDRLAEWRIFFSSMVERIDHDGSTATVTLRAGSEPLMTAVGLAEREKLCCSFFEFSIELAETEARLHIEVPTEAEPVLAGLLSLMGPPTESH